MMYSTLFLAAALPTDESGAPLNGYVVVGTSGDALVIHGQPTAPIPADALTIYYDGSSSWTWGQLADEYPDLVATTMPHEWAGEPTADDVEMVYADASPDAVSMAPASGKATTESTGSMSMSMEEPTASPAPTWRKRAA